MRKPIAFVVMPFRDDHRELYERAIRDALKEEGFEVVRADEILHGNAFIKNIFSAIESASLVIGVVTDGNANVMYELGYAERLGRTAILLVDKASSIPSDIRHINHLVYGNLSVGDTKTQLAEWVAATGIANREKKHFLLTRGEVLDSVVDSALYLQRTRPQPSKHDIVDSMERRQPFKQHLLYITEEGLNSYLELCADPEYDYYTETTQTISRNKSEIVKAILDRANSSEVDFISLGPGNGRKDAILLDEFCRRARNNSFVYYYPYDISGGMLLEAVRSVANKGLPTAKLRLKAIEADVQQLPTFRSVFDYRPEPNVFSLLGGLNITNSEVSLLKSIRSMLSPVDTFILEVRKFNPGETAAAMGQRDLNVRLDVSPLRYVGAEFDVEKLEYVESERPSEIPNTKTVVGRLPEIRFDGRVYRDVDLFPIDYYDVGQLEAKLGLMNFNIVLKFATNHSVLFVLAVNDTTKSRSGA